MRKPCLRERQPHREGQRAAPNHPDHRRAPGRPEVIAADEVAAEGLAHARTLKMTSVDVTDTALARFGPNAIRRGDKTGIELVMAGLHGWEAALRRRLMTTS